MRRLSSESAVLTDEYAIRIGRWSQYAGSEALPFGAMWCVVPPGGSSAPDRHPEVELAVVVGGRAAFAVEGGEPEPTPVGTAVLLDPEEGHVIHNLSDTEPVTLLSIYWLPEDGTAGTAGDAEVARDAR
ncbi:cupin domain-containing protein [Streptomyces sp. NPDC093261]|uniref:cupin domain-containing protein n=1 Tax=Streptomyces sp. NPDC093261 TaxID=3366037 RepID=UPI003809A163